MSSIAHKVWDAVVAAGRWLAEVPDESPTPAGLMPATRGRQAAVTPERALSLSTIYRGIQIHATAACQISLNVERHGQIIPEGHPLVLRPNLDQTRSSFIEYTVTSLYIDGNAFWQITRDAAGRVINLTVLNPHEVAVIVEWDAFGREKTTYGYRGKTLTPDDVKHLQLLRMPGVHRGLGPIQAVQVEIRGALDARDYGAMWLSDSNVPDGVLSTDQELGPNDADKYRHVWYGRNPDGTAKTSEPAANGERLRVLGKGLAYEPLMLKPSDVQFLETQQFTTVQMARLIGAPASLMLVSVEGGSDTYSNVEQEWIGYVRFTLMKPLREIEEAFTDLLPGNQTARFNVNALLRTDTKTRYEAHALSLDPQKGWSTRDEVRSHEGLAPLTDQQREELATRSAAPTTTTETDNA